MATIFRAPTFGPKQYKPPQAGSGWTVTPRLLTTLVLVSAVPFKTPIPEVVSQQHPSHARSANPDTSRGIPKPLYVDAAKAIRPDLHLARVVWPRLTLDDSTAAPPLALTALVPAPFTNDLHHLARVVWPRQMPDDSTAGPPLALLDGTESLPPGDAAWLATPRARWLNPDSSRGSSPDALLPPFTNDLHHLARVVWPRQMPDDSTAAPPLALTALVPAPFTNDLHLARVQWPRRTLDDTTQGALLTLLGVAPAPFVNPPQWSPPRFFWQPDDTSAGIPKPSIDDDATPTFNPPQHQVDRLRPVVDTSSARIKALYGDAARPTFNPPHLTADRIRPVFDTSRGASPGAIRAPFAQYDWPAPIAYRMRQLHGWDQQANPATIPPALPPAAIFPDPSQVLVGIVYGPNGTDYTGTLVVTTGGTGSVYMRRR